MFLCAPQFLGSVISAVNSVIKLVDSFSGPPSPSGRSVPTKIIKLSVRVGPYKARAKVNCGPGLVGFVQKPCGYLRVTEKRSNFQFMLKQDRLILRSKVITFCILKQTTLLPLNTAHFFPAHIYESIYCSRIRKSNQNDVSLDTKLINLFIEADCSLLLCY